MDTHPALRYAAFALGSLWALPMTALGLILGCAGLPFGARISFSDQALLFTRMPSPARGALTLGQVILHTGESLDESVRTYHCAAFGGEQCVRIGNHERAHVYQSMALGPLFLPLYFLHGGISHRNRFEQAADRYALTGRGWWPY